MSNLPPSITSENGPLASDSREEMQRTLSSNVPRKRQHKTRDSTVMHDSSNLASMRPVGGSVVPAGSRRRTEQKAGRRVAMPLMRTPSEETEVISQMINHTSDISSLLSVLPGGADLASGPTRKKHRSEERLEPDLSQQYQSASSSGNSSPQHDVDPDESLRVNDVDVWEVLEALQSPRGSLDSPEADLESFLQETPRSSPTLFRQQQSEADAGMFEVKPTLPEAPLPPTTFASNSKRTNGATANKRAAPGAAPRGATTPVKEAPLKQAPRSFPSPRATLELPPAGSQRSGSEDGDEDIDASNDPAEEKRLKRMRRNRESAAMSRNRKKAYIEELEAKVNSLTSMVTALQNENWALKEECAALRGLGQEGGSSSLDQSTFRPLFGANAAAGAMAGEQSKANGGTGAGQHASASKKFGTAGLALASTLALVTLSVNAPGSMRSPFLSGRPHSPTSRVLMSLRDEFREMQSSSALASRFREEASPLWPSLDVRQDDGAIAMNAPDEAALMPKAAAARVPSRLPTQRRLESPAPERVIHLPLNSSWADALLSEAADTMPNSGDKGDSSGDSSGDSEKLLLHRHSELSLLAQRGAWDEHGREEHALRGRVYEPQWHDEPSRHAGSGGYRLPDDAFEASSEAARRFIFCARSYAFDVVKQTGQTRGSEPHSPDARAATGRAGSRELPLPTAMPARFRHAAASVPQLTDGSNTSDAHAESTLRKPQLPVVSFLLPTAALGGVAQRVPHADHEPYDADKADSDLMQVTCQVLNASRI